MTLVDTSVWIAVLRSRDPFRIEDAVDFDDIATCLPVIQEVLQCSCIDQRALKG